ncbi:hypothetical protein VIGAN_01132200 [Vigna angularis var. angularis]|uniref:Uncharacterized protein n=1 Tax=Vigna angularis var. angularis TaxID=157739 RepID=A0A0S3QZP1_PHAAN|nr:hypothetical protein VIGAN_01132200 [Vigna angularis var. angularis]
MMVASSQGSFSGKQGTLLHSFLTTLVVVVSREEIKMKRLRHVSKPPFLPLTHLLSYLDEKFITLLSSNLSTNEFISDDHFKLLKVFINKFEDLHISTNCTDKKIYR